MRTFEQRETTFHFDDNDAPEPFWMRWGGLQRRVRLQPRYVVVEWKREGRVAEWLLWRVWVAGPRVHAQAGHNISETFFDSAGLQREMPDWLSDLVASTDPNSLVGAQ